MTHHRFHAHLSDREILVILFHDMERIMATQADVLARVQGLSDQVDSVAAAVAAGFAAVSAVDEQPVLDALEAVSVKVAAIPTHG